MAVYLDFIYVHTWPLEISWGIDRHDTGDHCLRLKHTTSTMRAQVSIQAAFIEVWCIFIVFYSGGLAYMWQWRIGYKPQSTIVHNIYCQSCRCYVSWSCLMLHYQWRTCIYIYIYIYILHKFSGNLWGKYPFLIGIDIFPQCLPTEFHLHYFPVEALFRL